MQRCSFIKMLTKRQAMQRKLIQIRGIPKAMYIREPETARGLYTLHKSKDSNRRGQALVLMPRQSRSYIGSWVGRLG